MASLFLDPVTLVCFCLVGLSWYAYLRGDRKVTVVTISILSIYLSLASPLLANSLTLILEGQVKPLACESMTPGAIVLLGGGIRNNSISVKNIEDLHLSSFRRTQVALKLAQEYSELSIIVSGGAGSIQVTEADLMSALLRQQGLSSRRLVKERKSTNTWESGLHTNLILKKENIKSVYLVTSALHMPRARRVYEKQGINVCPYPADRMFVMPKWRHMLIPQVSALVKTKNALYELGGLGWYYLSGKI